MLDNMHPTLAKRGHRKWKEIHVPLNTGLALVKSLIGWQFQSTLEKKKEQKRTERTMWCIFYSTNTSWVSATQNPIKAWKNFEYTWWSNHFGVSHMQSLWCNPQQLLHPRVYDLKFDSVWDWDRIMPKNKIKGGEVGVCFLPSTMGNRSNKTSVWPWKRGSCSFEHRVWLKEQITMENRKPRTVDERSRWLYRVSTFIMKASPSKGPLLHYILSTSAMHWNIHFFSATFFIFFQWKNLVTCWRGILC